MTLQSMHSQVIHYAALKMLLHILRCIAQVQAVL